MSRCVPNPQSHHGIRGRSPPAARDGLRLVEQVAVCAGGCRRHISASLLPSSRRLPHHCHTCRPVGIVGICNQQTNSLKDVKKCALSTRQLVWLRSALFISNQDFRLIRNTTPLHLRELVWHRDVVQEIGATIDDSRGCSAASPHLQPEDGDRRPGATRAQRAAPDHLTSSLQRPKLW